MISLVIPCYNEADRLPPTLDDILSYVRRKSSKNNARHISEIVVVDDGSRDSTLERALWFAQKFEAEGVKFNVRQLSSNSGKWSAIRLGINSAQNDLVLILDADGSAGIRNLDKLDSIRSPVFGSRFMLKSNVVGKSIFRTIVSYGYRLYALSLYAYAKGARDVNDLQCPWKLIDRRSIGELSSNRYAGDIELALGIRDNIENLGVDFVHMRGSKVKLQDVISMAKETAAISRRYRQLYFGKRK